MSKPQSTGRKPPTPPSVPFADRWAKLMQGAQNAINHGAEPEAVRRRLVEKLKEAQHDSTRALVGYCSVRTV